MAAVGSDVDVSEVNTDALLAGEQTRSDNLAEMIREGMDAADAVSKAQETGHDMKVRLNAMKVLTPAISAVIHRPGMDSAASEKKSALSQILSATNQATADISRIVSPDDGLPKWAESGVRLMAVELVAAQWRENGSSSISEYVELMRDISQDRPYRDLLDGVTSESFHKPASVDEAETMLHVSYLNGASKIQKEVSTFSFYTEKAVLINRLMQKCSDIARIDCPEILSAADVMHFQSSLGRAVDLMQAEYRATSKITVDALVAADDRGEYKAASKQVKDNAEKIISQIEARAEKAFKSLLAAASRMVAIQMQHKPQEGSGHGYKS